MRTLLVVQWLRIRVPKQGICVRSLVEELRSHMLWDNQTSTSQLDKACALQRKPSTAKKKKKRVQGNGLRFKQTVQRIRAKGTW